MLLGGLILSLLLLPPGYSQDSPCAKNFARVAAPPVEFRGISDPALQAELSELIPRLDQLLGGPRPQPVAVQLTSNSFYRDAFFLPDERAVKMGARLEDRTAVARAGVFAHEYAHAYFHDEFRFLVGGEWRNAEGVRAYARGLLGAIEADPIFIAANAERAALVDAIPRLRAIGPKEEYEKAVARFREVDAEKLRILKPYADASAAQRLREKISRAYSELFSDTIASVATRDRGVIADALGIPAEGPFLGSTPGSALRRNNPSGARPRAFEINHFKSWAAEDKFQNEYAALDPARGVLWKLYLANLPEAEAPKLARAFVSAAEEEVQRLFSEGADGELVKLPLAKVNQEFLRAFRRAAREGGLPTYR